MRVEQSPVRKFSRTAVGFIHERGASHSETKSLAEVRPESASVRQFDRVSVEFDCPHDIDLPVENSSHSPVELSDAYANSPDATHWFGTDVKWDEI